MLFQSNPAIKSNDDRLALWAALEDGLIDTIATDHAPHPLEAKQRPYFDAPSGIPSIQHSLQMMLESAYATPLDEAERNAMLTLVVQKMCHNPAQLFGIEGRGYIRHGYKADLVLVAPRAETVTRQSLHYRCGWSPLEGQTFHTSISQVFVNGRPSSADDPGHGEPLRFGC